MDTTFAHGNSKLIILILPRYQRLVGAGPSLTAKYVVLLSVKSEFSRVHTNQPSCWFEDLVSIRMSKR